MSLQNKTIERYRVLFPNDTLREISQRTGIQITRVFRLLNGKTMKIIEFEAMDEAIRLRIAENPNFSRLNELIDEAHIYLTNYEISKIADYIEQKITNKKYARTYIRSILDDVFQA